jgi:histidinol-phosphate/aromatic aminotransferase/cobyric acid decarboxylase-like protein
MKPVVEINSVAVLALRTMIKNYNILQEVIDSVIEGKMYLANKIKELGYPVFLGDANFIQVKLGKITDLFLKECHVNGINIKNNGSNGLLADWLRITAGNTEQMQKVINILERC